MKTVGFSKTSVYLCRCIRRHIPEESYLCSQLRQSNKYHQQNSWERIKYNRTQLDVDSITIYFLKHYMLRPKGPSSGFILI